MPPDTWPRKMSAPSDLAQAARRRRRRRARLRGSHQHDAPLIGDALDVADPGVPAPGAQ
jgi:hypothetical protein